MKRIISTYHHGFAGGSKNTCRLLHNLAEEEDTLVKSYTFRIPQYFEYTNSRVVNNIFDVSNFHSEVVDNSVLSGYRAINQMVCDLEEINDYTLFAANLFPYCDLMHNVKSQLRTRPKSIPKLIIHPVGSDIWQIGPQIKSRVKWLLESPLVDRVVTYSEGFISEICDYYDIKREICVLEPILEVDKFFVLNESQKNERRKELGFIDSDFLIHHHSSMRRVKCPEVVLEIAIKASQNLKRDCVLIMVGPLPIAEIIKLGIVLLPLPAHGHFSHVSRLDGITIYWTGESDRVEYLLQIADLEINCSLHDSFNISLLEAMACGVPIITSDVVGIKRHIDLSQSGLCFATVKQNIGSLDKWLKDDKFRNRLFDVDTAVDQVRRIEQDMTYAQEMGLKGAYYALKTFSSKKIINQFNTYL